MSTYVQRAAELLRERLAELDTERKQLDGALTALNGNAAPKRGPGRPKRDPLAGPKPKIAVLDENASRHDQCVEVIRQHPGITGVEIARALRMQSSNYLYRILKQLTTEGAITKRNRSYYTKADASTWLGRD
jgi:hypothetical protein